MDAVFIVVAVAEGKSLQEEVFTPAIGEIECGQYFCADVVDVAVRSSIEGVIAVFHPVNHVGTVPIEAFGLQLIEGACIGSSEMPVRAFFGFQLEITLQPWTIVVNVCVCWGSKTLVEGCKEFPLTGGAP